MKTQIILELIGEPQTGKTTLAEQLVHAFSPIDILLIDATPNQRLSRMMAFESTQTLGQTLAQVDYKPGQSREPIDWAFQELPAGAGQNVEVLTVGVLSEQLSGVQEEVLRYGLPRLLRDYEMVIVDGHHPAIHASLPEDLLTPVLLTTPQQNYRLPDLTFSRTPALIINRSISGDLPNGLSDTLEERELRLVGKLPDYPDEQTRIKQMGDDLHNCLLRMNLPVSLNL